IHSVEARHAGFLNMINGETPFPDCVPEPDEQRSDIFIHITDFVEPIDNHEFARLKTYEEIIEFTLVENDEGKVQAKNAQVLD
ncbi:MAG: hypothetical protein ABEN55_07965, partial [Bradymonadaceae bacterium]